MDQVLKEKGVTKYRFAKMLGLNTSNVSVYFKKDYKPNLSTLERWAGVLDCKVKDLFEE